MAGVGGSHYFDGYLHSHKLLCPNSSFQHGLFFMHFLDWTVEEIRYRLFLFGHELQVGAYRLLIDLLSRDCHSDSSSSSSLDWDLFTQSILIYCSLAAQIYKLVTMSITLNQKHCEFQSVRGSVAYWWAEVPGHQQSCWEEAFFWGLISEAAAPYEGQTTEANLGSWKYIDPNIPVSQNPVKRG